MAERRGITERVATIEDRVHFDLGVAPPDLEGVDERFQQRDLNFAAGRPHREPTFRIPVVGEDELSIGDHPMIEP